MARLKSPKGKGSGYERELSAFINEQTGLESKRNLLSGGGFMIGDADLSGTPHVWVEAKRTERFTPYTAMEQAEKGIAGRKLGLMPVVISRRNRMSTGESLVVMRLDDWMRLYRCLLQTTQS